MDEINDNGMNPTDGENTEGQAPMGADDTTAAPAEGDTPAAE